MSTKTLSIQWRRFWMHFASPNHFGKLATWLAGLGVPPYYGRVPLSKMNQKGYFSPKSKIAHPLFRHGSNVLIDDGVLVYQDESGGPVELGDRVQLYRDTILQTGMGGSIIIGDRTHIQPRCQLSAYTGSINIGQRVEIAPYCMFYPYNHGVMKGQPIRRQMLQSKGGIVIEDDVWLGVGVIVLDGVRIGKGAVVGAGSVVTKDLPVDSIASGIPASVKKMR